MSVYPPPIDQGTIFNPIDYGLGSTQITIDYLNANYLKFPVAQGYESMVGISNFDELDMNSNKIIALGTPTNTTDATTKIYVDGRTPALTPSTTYTNATITTNASGFISSVSAGTIPTSSLPYYFGGFGVGGSPPVYVAAGTQTATNILFDPPLQYGQLTAGTWLFLAQIKITAENYYGGYNNNPSGTAFLRILNSGSVVYQGQPAGVCATDDIFCGTYQGDPHSLTYDYQTNITLNALFTLIAPSTSINLVFTGGLSNQDYTSNRPVMNFTGYFQAIKIA
jgi:hypothetical protein